MFNEIKKNIYNDLYIINKSNKLLILILLILYYYTKKNIIFIFILYLLKNNNNINININLIEDLNNNIIQISNNNENVFNTRYINVYIMLKYIWTCVCNFNINPKYISQTHMRYFLYKKTNIIMKYPKNININIPDKFLLLVNHPQIIHEDNSIFMPLLLFPEHKYVIITNNKHSKISQKLGSYTFGQYIIKDDKSLLYEDMSNLIKNNKKIIIIIFPEGNIKRTVSIKNYDINQPKIDNFSIIEEKCFNYKKGAFIISLMNNIPILPCILYSPMPNNKYTYFDKIYKIKHINHIGINIFNFYNYKKKIPFNNINEDDIEKYRSNMEIKFIKRYINVLLNAHKYNI